MTDCIICQNGNHEKRFKRTVAIKSSILLFQWADASDVSAFHFLRFTTCYNHNLIWIIRSPTFSSFFPFFMPGSGYYELLNNRQWGRYGKSQSEAFSCRIDQAIARSIRLAEVWDFPVTTGSNNKNFQTKMRWFFNYLLLCFCKPVTARGHCGKIMPYNSVTISQSERALYRLQTQAIW